MHSYPGTSNTSKFALWVHGADTYYWPKKLNQSEPETQVQPILVTELVESCASCVVLTFNNGVRAELPTSLNSLQIKHWVEALQ